MAFLFTETTRTTYPATHCKSSMFFFIFPQSLHSCNAGLKKLQMFDPVSVVVIIIEKYLKIYR